MHAWMTWDSSLAWLKLGLLTWHKKETTQESPDPFHRERLGSGHNTRETAGIYNSK